jgi:hypothetical protein
MALPVTIHGFMVVTLEPNINPHSGRVLLDIALRKYDRYAHERKQCCLFLSLIKALCIMNSLLKIRQSRFLSGGSEMSVGCGTKKMAWNLDCRKLTPLSQ